jgi:cell division protein FtsI/penicillin-binding protein 2
VGVSQVAFRLGKTTNAAAANLYQTWRTYGIGQKTGIDLAGEVAGIVPDPAQTPWYQIDLANRSFGQGVAVPPIQIIKAYSEMANGGYQVTPHVADFTSVGNTAASATPAKRVISAGLSTSLVGLMQHVVTAVKSYDQATYIPGYFVGGKTGTAQIWDPSLDHGKGAWIDNVYNYSFYGWLGHDKPDLTIGVVIYEGKPTKIGQGVLPLSVQSTELFRRVATDAAVTLKVPPNPVGPVAPSGQKAKSLG